MLQLTIRASLTTLQTGLRTFFRRKAQHEDMPRRP